MVSFVHAAPHRDVPLLGRHLREEQRPIREVFSATGMQIPYSSYICTHLYTSVDVACASAVAVRPTPTVTNARVFALRPNHHPSLPLTCRSQHSQCRVMQCTRRHSYTAWRMPGLATSPVVLYCKESRCRKIHHQRAQCGLAGVAGAYERQISLTLLANRVVRTVPNLSTS